MSRCAGCGYEHGLLEGWCSECIANGTRDMAEAHERRCRCVLIPVGDERALPLIGHVYTDARGRKLRVDDLKVGAPDGREVVGAIEAFSDLGVTVTNVQRVPGAVYSSMPFSTTVATWARIWRDKAPAADPRKMKVGG